MNEILSIHDLSVNYGGIAAVKGISFDVHEGEIVTLIGANGAGKSSTLRTIAGLVKPSGGTINFRGDNITGRDATTIVKKGITLVPEGRHIFPDLTVLENLKVGAYLRNDDISGDIQWVYDLFPRLRERSWQAGGTLSGLSPAVAVGKRSAEGDGDQSAETHGGNNGDHTGNIAAPVAEKRRVPERGKFGFELTQNGVGNAIHKEADVQNGDRYVITALAVVFHFLKPPLYKKDSIRS